MKRWGYVILVFLGSVIGTVRATGLAETVRLNKVSREEFLKCPLGKVPAVQTLAAGLGTAPPDSSDKNRAPRFYLSPDQKTGLVESCLISTSAVAGLYVLSSSKRMDYYAWYDSAFNSWACDEGCSEDKDCYYEVRGLMPNAPIHRLTYHYEINLQAGQYDLELKPGHPIKVLKKKKVDLE